MPYMTVEPFTSAVLKANVDRVSTLCGIHQKPTLLTRGRDTVSALRRQEEPQCKGRIENVGKNCAAEQQRSKTPKKLLQVTAEINRLLQEKEGPTPSATNGSPPKTIKRLELLPAIRFLGSKLCAQCRLQEL